MKSFPGTLLTAKLLTVNNQLKPESCPIYSLFNSSIDRIVAL